ncbi:MAG: right-handed parallel beta-helix repeat-containing protein [Chloroflexota bacterium]
MLLLSQAAWPLVVPADAAVARVQAVDDQFDRVVPGGWGQAPIGGAYSVAGEAHALSVERAAGKMTLRARGAWATATLSALSLRDIDLRFRVATSKNATGNGQVLTVTTRRVSHSTEYRSRIVLRPNGSVVLSALSLVNGERRLLGSAVPVAGLNYRANSFLWVRVRIAGNSPTEIKLKVWQAGEPEPSVWSHSVSDRTAALSGAGAVGLGSSLPLNAVNAPVRFTFEDFVANAPNGAEGATTGDTSPASYSSVADTFDRTINSGWGSADVGGSYSVRGTADNYSVQNSSGVMTSHVSGVTRSALLTGFSARDIAISVTFSLNKVPIGGSYWIYLVGRGTGDSEYRAKVRVADTGVVYLGASKIVAGGPETRVGTEVALATPYAAGASWRVRAQLSGSSPTAITMMAWPVSVAGPGIWQYVGQDSESALQSTGFVGLRTYVSRSSSNAPFTVAVNDYAVTTADPPSGPTATPAPSSTPARTAAPTGSLAPTEAPARTATPNATATATPSGTSSPAATSSPAPTQPPAPTPSPTQPPAPSPTSPPNPTAPPGSNPYYVAPTGSDANPGTLAAPWKTLQKAADTVPAGATVYLRAGTYGSFVMRRSGTAAAPITFTAYGSEKPVVDGYGVAQYTIKIVGAAYVRVTGLTIRGSSGPAYNSAGITAESSSYIDISDNLITANKVWGVRSFSSTYVTIDGNEVSHNAVGIYVGRAGQGTLVTDNLVHHNDKMIVNTADIADDDAGGEGIALVMTTGSVTVRGNSIWGNRAVSYDYGYDGGAFSVFGASNWTITDNTIWDNRTVLESGTDANKTPCNNGRFTRNVIYGATTVDVSKGMILRCASNTIVANNTFHDLQVFVFDISHNKGGWGASIDGLQIVNNIIWVTSGKAYGIETWPLPASVVIDYNLVYNSGSGYVATVVGIGGTTSLDTFSSWTGFEVHGIVVSPGFVNAAAHDYHLTAGSPALDSGRNVPGVTDSYSGAAPDRGAIERP